MRKTSIVTLLALLLCGCAAQHNILHNKLNMDDINLSAATTSEAGFETKASGLKIKDSKIGSGSVAKSGSTVKVHYTGTLYPDGSKFDSSLDRGTPFGFKLGSGQVIKGWDEGIAGMKVGGKRTLIIPSGLGYGDRGFPPVIPSKATLKFDVELLEVN